MLGRLADQVHTDERGQMAFAVIISLFVVFILFGIAFDSGLWYLDHRNAQTEADAAALAGALELPSTSNANTQAHNWVTDNHGTGTVSVSFPSGTTKVKVCISRDSPGVFATLSGIKSATVSACAVATQTTQTVPYALMAMNTSSCDSLVVAGNGNVKITGSSGAAGTYTRSSCANSTGGLDLQGSNARLTSMGGGRNDVVGGANSRCTTGGQCSPPASPGAAFLDDPFASAPIPASIPAPGACGAAQSFSNGTHNLTAGCYKGLSISSSAIVDVSGVYVMEGPVSISGGTLQSNGNEVLFYMTCQAAGGCPTNNSVAAATFSTSGQANVILKGNSQYQNITVFVDRHSLLDTAAVTLAGQGSQTYTGAVYAINSLVTVSGNGSGVNVNVAIVSDKLSFSGNGAINVTYNINLIPPINLGIALTE